MSLCERFCLITGHGDGIGDELAHVHVSPASAFGADCDDLIDRDADGERREQGERRKHVHDILAERALNLVLRPEKICEKHHLLPRRDRITATRINSARWWSKRSRERSAVLTFLREALYTLRLHVVWSIAR